MTGMRRQLPVEVIVFIVGAATLGAEIAAARLLAPWFGASTIVWANTIAIVLVALAIGYSIGGRVADRNPTTNGLARIILVASILLAIVPFISGPFLRLAVTAVDDLSAGTFLGSLLGVGALIAVPLLLLGMVSPYAVRLRIAHVEDAGRVAGRLYAIGTVGSLTGTFLASLLLIPVIGTRRTFLLFALSLALVAIGGLASKRAIAAVVPIAMIALIALPEGTVKDVGAGKVIWERETEYQYARVVEESGTRTLELNEGHAIHSTYTKGEYLTGGYWDEMLALTLVGPEIPKRVAILGSAAGTTSRALGRYFPDTAVDAVEIDGDITRVGRELFDLKGPKLRTFTADARPWLEASRDRYDAILIDAYRQPYIPFYLVSREFFTEVREHLNPGGVMIINIGHPEGSDNLEKVLTATIAKAFGGREKVWRDPAQDTNTVVIATDVADPAASLRAKRPACRRPAGRVRHR